LRPLANFDQRVAKDVLGWEPRVGLRRGMDVMFGTEETNTSVAPVAEK